MDRPKIKFSHAYRKLVDSTSDSLNQIQEAQLLAVIPYYLTSLPSELLDYDTETLNGKHYKFQKGLHKIIILIFKKRPINHPNDDTVADLFTTIRSFTEPKAEYYYKLIGKIFDIIIPEIYEDTNKIKRILRTRIDELELSVKSNNCLRAANINTVADLVRNQESDMLKYKNFGRKSLIELNQVLANLGFSFGMDVDKFLETEEEAIIQNGNREMLGDDADYLEAAGIDDIGSKS